MSCSMRKEFCCLGLQNRLTTIQVYIFTDGSCGKTNESIAGWGVVAYETIHIEAPMKNNIDKHTVPAD